MAAELIYLDTSALIRWASRLAGSPETRDQVGQARLVELLDGPLPVYASPVTIAEFYSVAHTLYRKTDDWFTAFDDVALDDATHAFMTYISDGTIVIRDLGPRAFEMGLAYVASAAREHNRKLKAWDAIHLYEACRLSRDFDGKQVGIATSDKDFDGFLAVFPEFAEVVSVVNTTVEASVEKDDV